MSVPVVKEIIYLYRLSLPVSISEFPYKNSLKHGNFDMDTGGSNP